jgi:hypothetical protein
MFGMKEILGIGILWYVYQSNSNNNNNGGTGGGVLGLVETMLGTRATSLLRK